VESDLAFGHTFAIEEQGIVVLNMSYERGDPGTRAEGDVQFVGLRGIVTKSINSFVADGNSL